MAPETRCVSACLLGKACRYDGASKHHDAVAAQVAAWRRAGHRVVAVCPEELGGLGTPRPAAELRGGDGAAVWRGEAKVCRTHNDADVTKAFRDGAAKAAVLVEGATVGILKARSPSCGVGMAHRDGGPKAGDGVFASLLRQGGATLYTEESLPEPTEP